MGSVEREERIAALEEAVISIEARLREIRHILPALIDEVLPPEPPSQLEGLRIYVEEQSLKRRRLRDRPSDAHLATIRALLPKARG